MARQDLDHTGNEDLGRTLSKINAMFAELYAAAGEGGALSVESVTASGAVGGATAAITGEAAVGDLKLGTGTKTATAVAGAVTLAKPSGKITSEALTTAAGALYTLTITNTEVAATDVALASVANGTNTQGEPVVERVTPGAGSLVITVRNRHGAEALNGTLVISFASLKA